MKKALYIFFIVVLCLVIVFTLSHELRYTLINWFERTAFWLYPTNENRNAELLKIMLSVFAGFGVLTGIYVSLWRAKTTEKSVNLQSEAILKQGQQIQLSAKSQIDERFSNAIEHLGSEKEPVLLGGIAELHQIAKENPNNYAEVVFNILCSYIRSNTNIYKKNADEINGTAIQTIIDYLFKPPIESENPYKGLKADMAHSNLVDVDINNCNFKGANFSYCYMPSIEDVSMENANISKARFTTSVLRNINLSNSKTSDTSFHYATLENVTFENCQELFSIHFTDSELKNVKFDNAHIYGSSFIASLLTNVSFISAEVISTSFACSILLDVNFTTDSAMFELDFRACTFNETTFNCYISRSKFNGFDMSQYDFRHYVDERLNSRIGQESDVTALKFTQIQINNNQVGILSQNDVDEITNMYKKLIDPTEIKTY